MTIIDTRSNTNGTDTQAIRVLEGRTAFIRFGELIPVAQRSVIVFGNRISVEDRVGYVDVGSGFHATPGLNGNLVTVAIAPERSQPSSQGAAYSTSNATTTLSGRLGEWILPGGIDNSGEAQAARTLYSTRDYDASALTISIRVEQVN